MRQLVNEVGWLRRLFAFPCHTLFVLFDVCWCMIYHVPYKLRHNVIVKYFVCFLPLKRHMKTFNLEKINRQTRSKQEFGLPRKKGFFRKSMEITSLEASYWWAIYMLLHPKSMHIDPLTQCFWPKKKLKIDQKRRGESVMCCLLVVYKSIKCLAYLPQDASLFANTPAMKRFDVKKIHHHWRLLVAHLQQRFMMMNPMYAVSFQTGFDESLPTFGMAYHGDMTYESKRWLVFI